MYINQFIVSYTTCVCVYEPSVYYILVWNILFFGNTDGKFSVFLLHGWLVAGFEIVSYFQ